MSEPPHQSDMESAPNEVAYYPNINPHAAGANSAGLKRSHNSSSEFTANRRGGPGHRYGDGSGVGGNYKNRSEFGSDIRYTNDRQDDSGRYARDHKPPSRGWKRGAFNDSPMGYKSQMARGGSNDLGSARSDMMVTRSTQQSFYGGRGQRGPNKRGSSRMTSTQQSLGRMNSGESESRQGDMDFTSTGYAPGMNRYNGRSIGTYDTPSADGQRGGGTATDPSRIPDRMQVQDPRMLRMPGYFKGSTNMPKVPMPPPVAQSLYESSSKAETETPRETPGPKSARHIPPPPEPPSMKNPVKYGHSRQLPTGDHPVYLNVRDAAMRGEPCGVISAKQMAPIKQGDGSPVSTQSPNHRYIMQGRLPHVSQPTSEYFSPAAAARLGTLVNLDPWAQPQVAASAPPLTAVQPTLTASNAQSRALVRPAVPDYEVPQFNPQLGGVNPQTVVCLTPRVSNMTLQHFVEALTARNKRDRDREADKERSTALKEVDQPFHPKRDFVPPPTLDVLSKSSQTLSPTKRYTIEFCLALRDTALRYFARDMHPMKITDTISMSSSHSAGKLTHYRRRSLGSSANIIHQSPVYASRTEVLRPRAADSLPQTMSMPHSPSSTSVFPPTRTHTNKAQLPRDVALRRSVKGLLNKLTVEQFETIANGLSNELQKVQNVQELQIVVTEVFLKSVREPSFSEMYADLVLVLRARSPILPSLDSDKPDTFQRILLMKCQEEFDRMKDFANLELTEEERRDLTEDDIENERIKRKTRTLGNMRFIGELNQRKVVANIALAAILRKLIEGDSHPPSHVVECICELLTTIGYHMDTSEKDGDKGSLDTIFYQLEVWREDRIYESRINFVIQNLIELRESEWTTQLAFVDKANTLSNIRDSPNQNRVHVVGKESDYPYKAFVQKLNEDWLQRRKEQKKKGADIRLSPKKMEAKNCSESVQMLYHRSHETMSPWLEEEFQSLTKDHSVQKIVTELVLLGCTPTTKTDFIVDCIQHLTDLKFDESAVAVSQTLLSALEDIAKTPSAVPPISELLARLVLLERFAEPMRNQMIWPSQKKSLDARQLLEKILKDTSTVMRQLRPEASTDFFNNLLEMHGIAF